MLCAQYATIQTSRSVSLSENTVFNFLAALMNLQGYFMNRLGLVLDHVFMLL